MIRGLTYARRKAKVGVIMGLSGGATSRYKGENTWTGEPADLSVRGKATVGEIMGLY